jgi:hypothetical protein
VHHHEVFDVTDLAHALARFKELRPDPLCIPPNAATRATARFAELLAARDWDAMRTLCAPIIFEERRTLSRIVGGCDMVLANNQLVAQSPGVHVSWTPLATAGERLALLHFRATGSNELQHPGTLAGVGAFETDTLEVVEVDAQGHFIATVVFDYGDRRSASREMFERYARGEGPRLMPAAVFEVARALNAHDLGRMRAALAGDFFLDDHRRTGLGRITDVDQYMTSLAALFEAVPDLTFETLYLVGANARASLAVARSFGTLAEGGEVESVFARLTWHRDEKVLGVEMFEVENLDLARMRFQNVKREIADGGDA